MSITTKTNSRIGKVHQIEKFNSGRVVIVKTMSKKEAKQFLEGTKLNSLQVPMREEYFDESDRIWKTRNKATNGKATNIH